MVVASFFTGSSFQRNEYNLTQWQTGFYGLELLLNVTNISLGIAVLFLARTLGAMYIINNIESEVIIARARRQAGANALVFVFFFIFFLVRILLQDGYAYDTASGGPLQPVSEKNKKESLCYFIIFLINYKLHKHGKISMLV